MTKANRDNEGWLFLTDLVGENPKVPFAVVQEGFVQLFENTLPCMSPWFGKVDTNPKKSPLYMSLPVLHDYVCLQKYHIADKSYIIAAKGDDRIDKIEPLWDAVTHLYQFWETALHFQLWSFNELTEAQRYFSLFAQAAFLRARIDFDQIGPHTPQDIDDHVDNYFSDGEISLLAGETPKVMPTRIKKIKDHLGEDDSDEKEILEKIDLPKNISPICYHLDEYPELRYYSDNEMRTYRVSVWSRKQALYILESFFHYKKTNFTYSPS